MAVQALGYAGFGSAALDDWRQFGTGLVGLQAVERRPSLLAFRMDDRKQRIVIDRSMPDGARFFGWEVADAAALDALASRLEQAEVDVTAEPRALADNRRVRSLISFRDPAGNEIPGSRRTRRPCESITTAPTREAVASSKGISTIELNGFGRARSREAIAIDGDSGPAGTSLAA